MSNNTTEIDAWLDETLDLAWEAGFWAAAKGQSRELDDVQTAQFNEASAKLHKLLVEARLAELRKVGLHHDEYYIQRLESLKGSLEGEDEN